MVAWYDPGQLAYTAVEVLISTVFGKYADQRVIQALAGPGVIYDFTRKQPEMLPLGHAPGKGMEESALSIRGETVAKGTSQPRPADDFWFDFVADVGDGWDSTYAVASALANDHELVYKDRDGQEQKAMARCGEVLVFGGDEVYPTASRNAYEQRLVAPYRAAFASTGHYPTAFAMPGNHDWYDNLVSFSRLFCSNEPFAGPPCTANEPVTGCLTPQRRSYFALKLPGRWWLLGVDVQLGSDIDGPQADFFREVLKKMDQDDRVILCTPEPHWVYYDALKTGAARAAKSALDSLEMVLSRKVTIAVFIAGDVHHYCRYSNQEDPQQQRVHKITAGGGGAFLHPTHGTLELPALSDGGERQKYTHQASFPDRAKSRKLAWRNLLFPWLNPWFGVVPAVIYVAFLWLLMPAIEHNPIAKVNRPLASRHTHQSEVHGLYDESFPFAAYDLLANPDITADYLHVRILCVVLWCSLWGAFFLFTDLPSDSLRDKGWRALVALLHASTHFVLAVFLAWSAAVLAEELLDCHCDKQRTFWGFQAFWFGTFYVFVAGYFAGSHLMGLYLLIMLNLCRRHWNEAFSSLAIADWKSFVRFHIAADGTLTLYALGLRKVKRTRKDRRQSARNGQWQGPPIKPADLGVELIEAPIVVPGPTR
jgi:hypothetical protein